MNINISYFLEEQGWNYCWLYANRDWYKIVITHSFNDPIIECIDALIELMRGDKTSSFNWHGEPGGVRLIIDEISIQQNYIWLKVVEFNEDYLFHTKELITQNKEAVMEF